MSSPNADVNETAVELDVALKILCLSPPPRCASATKGYVTTILEMSMTLRMMINDVVWRGGSMVSVRDSRSEGREFDPRPRHTA